MITSPLERGKGVCYKTIFVDDCHTPLLGILAVCSWNF